MRSRSAGGALFAGLGVAAVLAVSGASPVIAEPALPARFSQVTPPSAERSRVSAPKA